MNDVILAAQKAVKLSSGCPCRGCVNGRKWRIENNVFLLNNFIDCFIKTASVTNVDKIVARSILEGRSNIQLIAKDQYRLLYNRPDLKLQALLE